jgi:hypothetical protein
VSRRGADATPAGYEAHALRELAFLVTDHGYRFAGAIPLVTAGIEARAWSNAAAGVQIEISSMTGGWFLGVARRLAGGGPVPYSDRTGWLDFDDIALRRSGRLGPNHNLDGWNAAVSGGAELLRKSRGIIEGREWIPRREANRAWNRWMSAQGREKWPDDAETESPLDAFREAFEFLVDLGYSLTRDTDRLSPHEYLVPKELRYAKGRRSVSIVCGDFRDATWRVEIDGRPIGEPPDFFGLPEETASRAALVAGELTED